MADFKTHITVSTSLGVAYGSAAYFLYGMPPTTCIVAGGLCSISGMLPDLDSDSGRPVREMISLLGAIIPMMMINRFRHLGWSEEGMACAAIVVYCIFRFGVAEIFKRYTVHRGMWHSIPACLTATLLAFLIVSGEDFTARAFKSLAVFLGFMSHLVLDEIWSFQVGLGGVRIKNSFGTALKFYSKSLWANVSTYAKLILVALLAFGDPVMMERFDLGDHRAPQITRDFFNRVLGRIEQARTKFEEGQGWRLVPRDQPTPRLETYPVQEPSLEPNILPASGEEPLPVAPPRRAETTPLPAQPRY